MSTWTFKARLLAGLALVALAGCETPAGKSPLGQASLADGAVRVVMPFGYCIDPRSLRPDFALAARCDTLGADGPYGGLDLALITITATPAPADGAAPDMDGLKAGLGGATVMAEAAEDELPLVLARRDAPPSPGLSATHWRGAMAVGGQIVALALFAPEGSAALSEDGAVILRDLAAAIRLASPGGNG